MSTWRDRMIARILDAKDVDAARTAVKDYIDPATGERQEGEGGDGDTHVHIHMEKHGEGGGEMRGGDEFNPDDPGGDPNAGTPTLEELAAQVASLSQRLAALEDDDEGEMELTDPDTNDARRFTYRRGAKMGTRDEDTENTPERNPEMIGETDLPAIEDLDKRMVGASSSDKRKFRDHALKTRDSADMEDTWRDMVAIAEVIQPGFRVGTWDARLTPNRQAERMCAFRRRIVDSALKDKDLGPGVESLVGFKTVDGLACDTVKVAFHSIGAALKQSNNSGITLPGLSEEARNRTADGAPLRKGPPTIAEMQKANREYWDKKNNGARRH